MTAPPAIAVDGREIRLTEGETILSACRRAGVDVPTICDDPRLKPLGACRLCVVEIEGQRRPVASCTTRAVAGMQVRTQSESLQGLRRTMLELVASENPDGLRVDPLRGMVANQVADLAEQHAIRPGRLQGRRSGQSRTDDDNPFILRDYDSCISCYRCVRVCAEQEGDFAIGIMNRGFESRIVTPFDRTLKDSPCTFCGQCVQTCPTGALGDKKALRSSDVPGETKLTRTVCGYCGVGCSVDVMSRGDTLVGVLPAMDGQANAGALCVKGQFAFDYVQHPDRLKTPLVRNDRGELEPASWEVALDRAADGFRRAAAEHGRHSIYAIASGRAPNEAGYVLQKFVRLGYGCHHVDNCQRG